MAKRELTARYLFFIAGLFVNAFGISLIIKANLAPHLYRAFLTH